MKENERSIDEVGRISIPRSIRKEMFGDCYCEGVKMRFSVKNDSIIMTPVAMEPYYINMSCVSFNKMNNDPLELLFNYDCSGIWRTILKNTFGIINDFHSAKICISVFSRFDHKIEMILSYEDGSQDFIDIKKYVRSIDQFIDILTDTDTHESIEALKIYNSF